MSRARLRCVLSTCLTVLLSAPARPAAEQGCSADLCVGPGFRYATPSAAALEVKDGQSVGIAAGEYAGDVAVWRAHDLTITGVGGRAHLRAAGAHAEGKAIWVIKGDRARIEHIEFSEAKVPDRNGAGVRLEGTHLTVRHCYFHDNETGILTGKNAASDVVVEFSEFARSGAPGAHPHNIYIGNVRSFTLKWSYLHHARVGHNVKSRAAVNHIYYNRIMDETSGRSSYSIDLPDGGLAYVVGNLIQQGPLTEHRNIVAYGAEHLLYPKNQLYLINNTLVNDGADDGVFVWVARGARPAQLVNNLFVGSGQLTRGPVDLRANLNVATSDLVDSARYDYRLAAGSRAIGAGVAPGSADGVRLRPDSQYLHPLSATARRDGSPLDIGALAYQPMH